MEAAYQTIIETIKAGGFVSKQDMKFMASYRSLLNAENGVKGAGNAGKRKQTKTGH